MFGDDRVSERISGGTSLVAAPFRVPDDSTSASTSAALCFLLPIERPVIVTDQPIFADCREWVMRVTPRYLLRGPPGTQAGERLANVQRCSKEHGFEAVARKKR